MFVLKSAGYGQGETESDEEVNSETPARDRRDPANSGTISTMKSEDSGGGDSFSPPESVRAAARRGLEYRRRAGGKGGLTNKQASKEGIGSGVQRGTNLASGSKLSKKVIRQMHAFFSRHRKNKGVAPGKQPWEDRGHVAWLIWGGDPGAAWAAKMVAQFDRAEKSMNKSIPLIPELMKGMTARADEWCEQFYGTPLYDQALALQIEYMRESARIMKEHVAQQKVRDKAERDLAQAIQAQRKAFEKQHPYYSKYGKMHDLQEKFQAKRDDLVVKLLEHRKSSVVKSGNSVTLRDQETFMQNLSTDELAALMVERASSLDSAGLLSVGAEIEKSLVSYQTGESVSGASIGHERLSASARPTSNQKFSEDPKNGMPSVDAGELLLVTEDDETPENQLKDKAPSDQVMARGAVGGAAQLASLVSQDMHGPRGPGGGAGAVSKAYDVSAEDVMRHYGVIPQAPVSTDAQPVVRSWMPGRSAGLVVRDFEDQFIEKAQNERGYIQVEPTMDLYDSPLMKSHECPMCKSRHPAMFTRCPECHHDHMSPAGASESLVRMDKSVYQSMRRSGGDQYFPGGMIRLPSQDD